jgi:hypothetical protein
MAAALPLSVLSGAGKKNGRKNEMKLGFSVRSAGGGFVSPIAAPGRSI